MGPDSKVHGASMGPIWDRQDPGGPHELCYLRVLSMPNEVRHWWYGLLLHSRGRIKHQYCIFWCLNIHYIDVIMTKIAPQITSLTVVYSTVYSDADQRKHQSSASLAFVWGIHRDRWIPRTKTNYAEKVSIWWRHHDKICNQLRHDILTPFAICNAAASCSMVCVQAPNSH